MPAGKAADDWVAVGVVLSVNPNRREVRLKPLPDGAHELEQRPWLRLRMRGDEIVRCRVETFAWHNETALITVAAGVPRDLVGRLKGAVAVLRRDERTLPPGQAWFREELPGCRVESENGEWVGVLKDLYTTPTAANRADGTVARTAGPRAGDVAVIERPDGSVVLAPLIDAVVRQWDAERGVLVVGDLAPYAVEQEAGRER
jgi:ribosomal 30S subunit maturation factor RimM